MADYYSILKKTISGLPSNTTESRKLVYTKARAAIDRQLRNVQPAPSEAAIANQMASLEESIDRLEEEFSSIGDFDDLTEVDKPDLASRPEVSSTPAPDAEIEQPPKPGGIHPKATVQPGMAGGTPDQIARRDVRIDPYASDSGGHRGPAYDASIDALDEVDQLDETSDRGMAGSRPIRKKRSGGFASVLIGLIVIALLGLGGYALWLNKDPLMSAIGIGQNDAITGLDDDTPVDTAEEQSDAAVPENGTEAGMEKESARLGGDGKTVESESPADSSTVAEDNATPQGEEQAQDAAPEEEPAQDNVEVNPVGESGNQTDQTASQPGQSGEVAQIPAIGQKAFLYEEGLGNAAATRDNAAVVWSLVQQPPTEGSPPEAVIKGELEVPGRGLDMTLTIKRNVDESLSASHIIELVFDAPPDFSGGAVDTLARFVMKSNEQARGEPLVAVPVKIDNGFFMIALNNLEQAKESNKRLLLDSNWIDIPLGYTSGRRALVTLEKGAIGDKVFRDAFADWDNR